MSSNLSNMPQFIIKKARAQKLHTIKEIEQAKARIETEYHDFLVMLPQNVKLNDKQYKTTTDAEELGIWSTNAGTYMSIEKPYMTVDGRVQMARDEHRELKKQLHIHQPVIEKLEKKTILSVTVESEMFGTTTGTIEIGESGAVDNKNPIANAQTSAIGRALGFMGYGLVGTGIIASADELLDQEEPEGETPTGRSTSSGTAPTDFRVLVQQEVAFNRDGSSTVEVKLETHDVVELVIPKLHSEFSKALKAGAVIRFKGWLNNKRIRMANNKPEIENSTSAQAG